MTDSGLLTPPQRIASSEVSAFLPAPPVVHHERILRIQGYSDFTRIRPAIVKAAQTSAALAPELAAPRVAFRRVPVAGLAGDELRLPDDIRLHCAAFAGVLAACDEVAVFVLTLGPKIDARVVALTEDGDLLDALLLETAAWLCIEDATRQFRIHLRQWAAQRGRRITSRMGPGYSYRIGDTTCTWPLEEHPALFALFGDARLPVHLMESCAMQPKMSRSGLIGIGPRGNGSTLPDADESASELTGESQ